MNKPVITKIILPVLFVLILSGGIFFYFKTQKPAETTPANTASTDSLPAGVSQAQEEAKEYPALITSMNIQQSIQGTLTAINTNSWTLESNNQSLTIKQDAANAILYAKIPQNASESAKAVSTVEIKPEELKVGNKVLITRLLSWATGASMVTVITVLP